MPNLCLASSSPYRKRLLERLGFPFRTESPSCDESQEKRDFLLRHKIAADFITFDQASALALHLSEKKAQSIEPRDNQEILIGSDQICFCSGKILGKAGSEEKALETLQFLRGRSHFLITAVTLISGNFNFAKQNDNPTANRFKKKSWVHLAELRLRSQLSDKELLGSIRKDKSVDTAGAYKLEGTGIGLMESIQCEDWTGIEGLPLLELNRQILNWEV